MAHFLWAIVSEVTSRSLGVKRRIAIAFKYNRINIYVNWYAFQMHYICNNFMFCLFNLNNKKM